MSLTRKQAKTSMELFVNAFCRKANVNERNSIFIQFEDVFGLAIENWQEICRNRLIELNADATVLEQFDLLCNRKDNNQKIECDCRLLEEKDFPAVRDIINQAFDFTLTELDDDKLRKFMKTGYSLVACRCGEVVGVVLAYELPDLLVDTVWVDTIAVIAGLRGCGIGGNMLKYLNKLNHGKNLHKIQLQTSKDLDAYQIYKHWGFTESDYVCLQKYML